MSELFKIILTSCLTVFGGIVVFVIGQIIVKFVIEPMLEQSRLIGEIASSLIFYANVGSGIEPYYYKKLQEAINLEEPLRKITVERYEEIMKKHWKDLDDASEKLRRQASELMGKSQAIPMYGVWALLNCVPRMGDVLEASSQLIGMANSTHQAASPTARIIEIAKLLRIETVSKRFNSSKKELKKRWWKLRA